MKVSVLFIIIVFIFGCNSMKNNIDKDEWMSSATVYQLSQKEKNKLIKKGEQGDKNAAFRLYKYYLFTVSDENKADAWLKKAAQQGHKIAHQSLKILENEKKEAEDDETKESIRKHDDESEGVDPSEFLAD